MNIKLLVWSVVKSYTPFFKNKEKRNVKTTVTVEHEPKLKKDTNHKLVEVDGIGPSYAEKLKSVGIKNVSQLASKSPKEISSKVSVSKKYANRWISSAKEFN